MKKPVLVIMAAGMGSRFGGMKQITPVDPEGHIIMDFSLYDAKRAGFETAVIIIKRENEADFRRVIGDRAAGSMEIRYAYQSLDDLPEGFRVPEGRTKPWGTGHAVLSARRIVDGPFAVINADDFYGRGAFAAIYGHLASAKAPNEHAMVGYQIQNTLTENGYVARGVCETDGNGYLTGVTERVKIRWAPGGAEFTEDNGETFTFVPGDTTVSLNLWGFGPDMMLQLASRFPAFLEKGLRENPLKCEYFIPTVANAQIEEKLGTVRVLPTDETWYGVTYREDLKTVQDAVASMKRRGIYPERLW